MTMTTSDLLFAAILAYNHLAEVVPLSSQTTQCRFFVLFGEAAVFDTPDGQLLPTVQRYSRVADHDLIEFVGH